MATATKYAVTWELDSLLPHPESEEFRAELDQFRANLEQLADRSNGLPAVNGDSQSVAEWTDFLKTFESVDSRFTDIGAFVGCHSAADAESKHLQRLEGELSALGPQRSRILTNIEFALKDASDDDFAAFVAASDDLKTNAFFLEECRRSAQLRLPKDQEMLAADLGVDGVHAWGRLYDRISSELRIQVMERGEIVERSPGQVHFDSPQPTVRENNYYAADKAWSTIADTCADALNHISGTRLTKYRRLNVHDHLDAPLQYNRMTRETLQTMWSTITARKPILLKYMQKKAELLGLDKLRWYDMQAPLPRTGLGNSSELSYDAACDIVIDTFNGFSPDFGDFARHAIDKRWIEVENREGKRQGGFCTGFPTKQESRIFMTFTNTPDSMSTLAHELGHAYHSFVLREQPILLQDYPMNLAETASTFAEAVLGEQRLQAAGSNDEQLIILDNMLSDSIAFLMNIHARFIFEDKFHQERQSGELSAERFSELMLAAQQAAYLDGLADDGWNPNFWISKLHFYISGLPFYNFPYTFGYLLSLGAYALAKDAGDDFPNQYRQLLIATGCKETEDAVQSTLGYDLTDASFWNKSLDIVEGRVNQFLELAN